MFDSQITQHYCCVMLPPFTKEGTLSPGIHWAAWNEFARRFGGTPHRRKLLRGLRKALRALRAAGCLTVYVDGSFVTTKPLPRDFDGCWDIEDVDPTLLDPVLLEFNHGRAAQKAKYLGELFPAQMGEGGSGLTFLDFFQIDKESGKRKGIVAIDLRRWKR